MSKKELSERQKNMLEYIASYIQKNSRPPTIREIGREVEISSTSVVNYNLTRLTERGYLTRQSEVSRGLNLTDKTKRMFGLLSNLRVPLFGSIQAGEPIEVGSDSFQTFDEEDYIEISFGMVKGDGDKLFALRVSGDSMIDAMVNDGDIVILRQADTARNGDMVAAWITGDDTTTLKYFYQDSEQIRLQPANPNYEPIFVEPSRVKVQGKVEMVIRQY